MFTPSRGGHRKISRNFCTPCTVLTTAKGMTGNKWGKANLAKFLFPTLCDCGNLWFGINNHFKFFLALLNISRFQYMMEANVWLPQKTSKGVAVMSLHSLSAQAENLKGG